MQLINWFNNKLEEETSQISLWFFTAFYIGIISYFSYKNTINYYSIFIATILIVINLWVYFSKYSQIGKFFLAITLGLSLGATRAFYESNNKEVSLDQSINATIIGQVTNIDYNARGILVTISDARAQSLKLSKVKITIQDKYAVDLNLKDKVKIRARLYPIPTNSLPYGYDFKLYSKLSRISALGYAYNKPIILNRNISINGNDVFIFLSKLRSNIRAYLYHKLPYVEASIISALMIGEAKTIPQNIRDDIRNAGIAHILCVSGLHLGLVAMFSFIFFRIFLNVFDFISNNVNVKKLAGVFALLTSILYWLISGMNVATTRSSIMTSCILIAVILEKFPHPMRSLAIAAFIILLYSPKEAIHPSFQLSFTAVLVLLSSYQFYSKNIMNFNIISKKSVRYFFANLYSSTVVSISLIPIILKHFFSLPNYSVITNLIVIPLMSFFIMPLTLISLVLIPLDSATTSLNLLSYGIKLVIYISSYISSLPYAVCNNGYITEGCCIVFLLGLFWLTIWQTKWRLLGFLPIFISFIMMFNIKIPNIVFDSNRMILAIKDNSIQHTIYASKLTKFQKKYWHSWLGQEDSEFNKIDWYRSNHEFTSNQNKILLLTHHFECIENAVVINVINNNICQNAKINITKNMLTRVGVLLLDCDKSKCVIN